MTPDRLLNHFNRIADAPDAIPRLRRFIFDLAVRGNLVEQNSNDEPASELLKRIQAWRSAAISEGKIRMPRKQILVVDASEAPYELPKLWDWVRLGQIIYIHSGDGLTSEAMRRGSVPVFGGNGLTGFHDTPNVLRPTVVIGRVGYYCGSIHVTPSQAWITDNAFITEFCTDAIFQNFLVLLLKATNLKENEKATAQPVISGPKIYPIIVGLPPLAEQHRIVAKVDELMALCDRLEAAQAERESRRDKLASASLNRLNNGADADEFREHARFHLSQLPRLTTRPEHIQQMRQAILNLAVRGKLVPQDPNDEPASVLVKRIGVEISDEQPFQIPDSWTWVSVGQIGD